MMTIAGTFAGLISMHERQLSCRISANNVTHCLHRASVGKIDMYASIGKTAHGSCSYSANNDSLGSCFLQNTDWNHTATSLVVAVDNSRHGTYTIVFCKFDEGKNITMTEVIGALRFEPPWIV